MTLLKLKDVNIDNISDDLEEYSVFAGTFNDSDYIQMNDFQLSLEDGRVVELNSIHVEEYGDPSGFRDIGNFFVEILRMVSNGESENMTLEEFLRWMYTSYSTGPVKITITDGDSTKIGLLKILDPQGYVSYNYYDWARKQLTYSDRKYLGDYQDEINQLEQTKSDVFIFNVDRFEFGVSNLEDFLK